MTLDFDTDEFLRLLTDALRAGPGSPQWRQAVRKLDAAPGADEYKQLLEARENLESGKPYRAIQPGAEFTRKVLAGVEDEAKAEGGRRAPASPATVVAVAGILVALAALGVVAYLLLTGGRHPHKPSADELSMQSFDRQVLSSAFDSGIPQGWKPVGPLGVRADHGLRLAGETPPAGQLPVGQGGGLVRGEPLAAGEAFEVDATVRYTGGAGVVPEVFVTDDPDFANNPSGTSPHEFAWAVLDDKPQVQLPDRTLTFTGGPVGRGKDALITVKIRMNEKFAVVETGGPVPARWAGEHQLSPDKPRYLGVRFLVRGPKAGRVAVETVRVGKP